MSLVLQLAAQFNNSCVKQYRTDFNSEIKKLLNNDCYQDLSL